jgi:hypothetical protein
MTEERNIKLYRKLDSGHWKYVMAYKSTLDKRYHEDINSLTNEGHKLKALKHTYEGHFVIFETK